MNVPIFVGEMSITAGKNIDAVGALNATVDHGDGRSFKCILIPADIEYGLLNVPHARLDVCEA